MTNLRTWIFVSLFFGIGTFSFGESIEDPIQSQTVWKGTCSQSCMQPYEMILKISERNGNEINGTLEWPIVKCRTRFKGYISDKNISLTESDIIEGNGIVVPTTYLGKVEKENITGTWLSKGTNTVANGQFKLIKTFQMTDETKQKKQILEEYAEKLKIADSFNEGKGVRQNKAKALELYSDLSPYSKEAYNKAEEIVKLLQLAEANVDQEAMRILGVLYQKGLIVPQDLEKSFRYFKSSSELGNIHAQMNLGFCYLNGLGTQKDLKKAIYWYTKSADAGNADALQSLSQFYLKGVGTEINLQKAYSLIKESAEKGNADAQYNMALFYSKGLVVPQNYGIAKQWCEKAANNNNEDAKKLLSGLRFIVRYDKNQSATNPQ